MIWVYWAVLIFFFYWKNYTQSAKEVLYFIECFKCVYIFVDIKIIAFTLQLLLWLIPASCLKMVEVTNPKDLLDLIIYFVYEEIFQLLNKHTNNCWGSWMVKFNFSQAVFSCSREILASSFKLPKPFWKPPINVNTTVVETLSSSDELNIDPKILSKDSFSLPYFLQYKDGKKEPSWNYWWISAKERDNRIESFNRILREQKKFLTEYCTENCPKLFKIC